jgi:hypothetical protein
LKDEQGRLESRKGMENYIPESRHFQRAGMAGVRGNPSEVAMQQQQHWMH